MRKSPAAVLQIGELHLKLFQIIALGRPIPTANRKQRYAGRNHANEHFNKTSLPKRGGTTEALTPSATARHQPITMAT